jgi:hypothetical protein
VRSARSCAHDFVGEWDSITNRSCVGVESEGHYRAMFSRIARMRGLVTWSDDIP